MDGQREFTTIEYEEAENYVAVRMRDDSMKGAGILIGSLIIVRMQRQFDIGDIVYFMRKVNGKLTAYLRRAKYIGGATLLVSEGEGELLTPEDGDFVLGVVVEVKTIIKKKYAA